MITHISRSLFLLLIIFALGCKKNDVAKLNDEENYKRKLFELLHIDETKLQRSNAKADFKFKTYKEAYEYLENVGRKLKNDTIRKSVRCAYKPLPSNVMIRLNGSTQVKSNYSPVVQDYESTYCVTTSTFESNQTLLTTFRSGPRIEYNYSEMDYFPFERTYNYFYVHDMRITDINFLLSGGGSITPGSQDITNNGFTEYLTHTFVIDIGALGAIQVSRIIQAVGTTHVSMTLPQNEIPPFVWIHFSVTAAYYP